MRINLIDTMRANSKTLRFRQRGLPNMLIECSQRKYLHLALFLEYHPNVKADAASCSELLWNSYLLSECGLFIHWILRHLSESESTPIKSRTHCRVSGGMVIFLGVSAAPERIFLSKVSYAPVQHSSLHQKVLLWGEKHAQDLISCILMVLRPNLFLTVWHQNNTFLLLFSSSSGKVAEFLTLVL